MEKGIEHYTYVGDVNYDESNKHPISYTVKKESDPVTGPV